MLAAIRRALAGCKPGAATNSKAASVSGGFAFLPTNADFREGIVGAIELANGRRDSSLASPMRRRRGRRLRSDHKSIGSSQSASSGIFATAEPTYNRSQDQRAANGIGATSGKHSADTEPLRL